MVLVYTCEILDFYKWQSYNMVGRSTRRRSVGLSRDRFSTNRGEKRSPEWLLWFFCGFEHGSGHPDPICSRLVVIWGWRGVWRDVRRCCGRGAGHVAFRHWSQVRRILTVVRGDTWHDASWCDGTRGMDEVDISGPPEMPTVAAWFSRTVLCCLAARCGWFWAPKYGFRAPDSSFLSI